MNKNIVWSDIITSSHHIKQIGYNIKKKILYIIFYNNEMYEYIGVPADTVIGLLQSSSHGKYFWEHIRNVYNGRLI